MALEKKKKVLVAMSGGVDSSVAAALLMEAGYDVAGVTMRLLPCTGCNYPYFVADAKQVAQKLGIEHRVVDFIELFKEKVIDSFQAEYLAGRTPNPCVMCNKWLKFGALLDYAIASGFDYLATGHYAIICRDNVTGKSRLKRSLAAWKDQTYVLYNLNQVQLDHILLPLGELDKKGVRKRAKALGFAVADKPDSQEICFVPDNDYAGYIEKNSKSTGKPGNFVDTAGNVIGRHRGIIHYTVGQRRGLGMSFGQPKYVVAIRPQTNEVVLGDEKDSWSKQLIAREVNFLCPPPTNTQIPVWAKIRYSAVPAAATILPLSGNCWQVVFQKLQQAITPGQSVVFYDNEEFLLGGGIIC